MATTEPQSAAQHLLREQLLRPLEEGVELARRYRDVDGLREYVKARLPLVIPACVLILVTAIACGLTPLMLLLGTRAIASLAGLVLTPVMLIGSLFVLSMAFFSWLEKRALALALGPRRKPASNKLSRWVKRKFGADLGAAPDVPWLLAALFVIVPFVLLAAQTPVLAVLLLVLLVAAPVLFARLER
jgi:hypothetical protein